jgi:hypothetical protein
VKRESAQKYLRPTFATFHLHSTTRKPVFRWQRTWHVTTYKAWNHAFNFCTQPRALSGAIYLETHTAACGTSRNFLPRLEGVVSTLTVSICVAPIHVYIMYNSMYVRRLLQAACPRRRKGHGTYKMAMQTFRISRLNFRARALPLAMRSAPTYSPLDICHCLCRNSAQHTFGENIAAQADKKKGRQILRPSKTATNNAVIFSLPVACSCIYAAPICRLQKIAMEPEKLWISG